MTPISAEEMQLIKNYINNANTELMARGIYITNIITNTSVITDDIIDITFKTPVFVQHFSTTLTKGDSLFDEVTDWLLLGI